VKLVKDPENYEISIRPEEKILPFPAKKSRTWYK